MLHATIIAKEPIAGKVKTRLCPPLMPEQAAQVAEAALRDSIEVVLPIAGRFGARPTLLFDGAPPGWVPRDFTVIAQRGDGLDQRLANGFTDLGPGVIIGMETPQAASRVGEALSLVSSGLDVLALATDGGYWMIGLSTASAAVASKVFDEVPMSRSNTGLRQLRRLQSLGRPVRLLDGARDLDTFEDLVAIAGSGHAGRLGTLAREIVDALA
jgi:glycosyltransferase A (GT-A) superfamily protein (DUF2064 family)